MHLILFIPIAVTTTTTFSLTGHSSVDPREAGLGALVPEADYSLLGVLELAILNEEPSATVTLGRQDTTMP